MRRPSDRSAASAVAIHASSHAGEQGVPEDVVRVSMIRNPRSHPSHVLTLYTLLTLQVLPTPFALPLDIVRPSMRRGSDFRAAGFVWGFQIAGSYAVS